MNARQRSMPVHLEYGAVEKAGRRAIAETLAECLRYFAHHDEANAAIHGGDVRYSPLTFRVAEALDLSDTITLGAEDADRLTRVLEHHGTYAEDKGRGAE